MSKVLVLFSGGLDSLLAVKILERQNVEVEGTCFTSNFFDCKKAEKAAKANGIKLRRKDISAEMVELVKNPERGFGKNMNPCIDCHALMIKLGGEIAKQEGFDFVATGEVLGQRPFSQNKQALREVQKKSGVEVLRPLSAKLLEKTSMEKQGLVNREDLLDIHGRSREKQNNLIREFGIKEYESPGGGCLLTDPDFSTRLTKALQMVPKLKGKDIELLKKGRIYWFWLQKESFLLVVGRNREENEEIIKQAKKGDLLIYPEDLKGPVSLLRNFGTSADLVNSTNGKLNLRIPLKKEDLHLREEYSKPEKLIRLIAELTGWYTPSKRGKQNSFIWQSF